MNFGSCIVSTAGSRLSWSSGAQMDCGNNNGANSHLSRALINKSRECDYKFGGSRQVDVSARSIEARKVEFKVYTAYNRRHPADRPEFEPRLGDEGIAGCRCR
jgi:hypothetical protein